MRVDKTILFNTMIFTCHLSLSLRSVNRIDSISSTVQNTNWKKKKNSPIQRRRQWQISQPHNTLTHMHAHTITKQGFGDWEFGGVYVRRIWTVNLGANSVWGKDRCVLSHQDSKFRGKCFWKAPHSYSNRLTATNIQTKHNKTLTVEGRQLTDGNNWFMHYAIYAAYGRLRGFIRKIEDKYRLCVCVALCRIRVERGLWHEWVVKMPKLLWYVMIWGGSGKWLIRSMLLVELC